MKSKLSGANGAVRRSDSHHHDVGEIGAGCGRPPRPPRSRRAPPSAARCWAQKRVKRPLPHPASRPTLPSEAGEVEVAEVDLGELFVLLADLVEGVPLVAEAGEGAPGRAPGRRAPEKSRYP